jgi:hypothetical protein
MLLYGSENRAVSRSERRRIETPEMRFLRRVSGYTLRNRVRNMTIRNAVQIQ